MFQGWITPQLQIADETFRAWSVLVLPIFVATLVVVLGRLTFERPTPSFAGVVEVDRQRLGDRRFSSARLWFSAFTAQLTAAEGIETHIEGDDCLDLELVSIQETILASSAPIVDDDRDALDWLVGHFRRQLVTEETSSSERPALSACWVVFGQARTRRLGVRGRTTAELRVVNCSDLGRQAFVTVGWTARAGRLGRSHHPIVAVVREPDPALLVEHLRDMPRRLSALAEADHVDPATVRLAAATRRCGADLPLTDPVVAAIDGLRPIVTATWGDRWWTPDHALDTGLRSIVELRCSLHADAEPRELRRPPVVGRDSTGART